MPTVTIEGEKPFEVESGKKLVLGIEDSGGRHPAPLRRLRPLHHLQGPFPGRRAGGDERGGARDAGRGRPEGRVPPVLPDSRHAGHDD